MCINQLKVPEYGLHLLIVQALATHKPLSRWVVFRAGGIALFLHHEERFLETLKAENGSLFQMGVDEIAHAA